MTESHVTLELLAAAREGDREAFDRLYARTYAELRSIARLRLRKHRPGETLNTTALVHESYLRLVDQEGVRPADRTHFLALASRAMRFILVDDARARRVQKRGGGQVDVTLERIQLAAEPPEVMDLVALDDALKRLRALSERQGQVVEYRFFGGLTFEEIAELTGVSVRTAKRDWIRARTWLYTYMHEGSPMYMHEGPQ